MPTSPLIPRTDGDGDCYRSALDRLVELWLKGKSDGWALCHGMVTGQGPIEGLRTDHAWLERTVHLPGVNFPLLIIWDHSNGQSFEGPAALYYLIGQIDPMEVRRYDFKQARAMVTKHGHYGPWEDEDAEGTDSRDEVVRAVRPAVWEDSILGIARRPRPDGGREDGNPESSGEGLPDRGGDNGGHPPPEKRSG